MESTVGPYKTEVIDQKRSWTRRNQVERETALWVHWVNTKRLDSAIDYRRSSSKTTTTVTPRPPADLAGAQIERPSDPGRFTVV
jgi:hypothetical protein